MLSNHLEELEKLVNEEDKIFIKVIYAGFE